MRVLIYLVITLLLLLNGIGAVYGGLHLIAHPNGGSLGLSVEWLRYSPFKSYLIPGFILFVANGVFSFLVLALLWLGKSNSYLFVIAQGFILSGWILIQISLLRTVYFLHYFLGGAGILLILTGYCLRRMNHHSGLFRGDKK